MAGQAVSFVLEVFFGLFIYGFLLRFLMQALRAPFRNPAGQAVIALTDWAVKPLRRVIPGAGGYDWASLVAAWLTQVALIATLYAVFSSGFAAFSGNGVLYVLASAAVQLLKTTITLAMVVVIVQAILSWVAPDGPLAGLLNALTFPFLRPLRRVIPPIGGALDLSPLVLIVVAQALLMVLESLLSTVLRLL